MKTRKTPMRRCVGCMESKPKNQLIRIACYEGQISLDPSGRAKGRGVYLCPSEDCLKKAEKKKALQRSFQTKPDEQQLALLLDQIRGLAEQKAEEKPPQQNRQEIRKPAGKEPVR